ncbi:putative holliday junction resolvase [Vibrio phage vB_ValP_VA-RY-3]|nr:putative holliday junction resolvase [Vibrio phage vB_ValP_VA-RY-3]
MICELYTDFPPSVNNYYVKTQRGLFISQKGRKFRDQLIKDAHEQLGGMDPIECKVRIDVVAWVPDNRKRDLDNLVKPIQDAISHAHIWGDDSQVDQLVVYRGEKAAPNGALYIRISEAAPCIPRGMEHLIDSGE